MAFKVGAIVSELELKKDQWNHSIKKVKEDQKSLSGLVLRNSKSFAKMGRAMTVAGGIIVGSVGLIVKAYAGFDQAMTESLAIMGDVSDETRKKMSEVAKTISEETTYSAKELAEAYFFLASAGMDTAQSMTVLGDVARFAQAGAFDLSTATDLLTDAQTALGLSSKDTIENQKELIRVSDVLVGANTLANASVKQFAEALTNKAAAALVNVNVEVEEGVAVLAAYADKGIKGTLAGQRLTMMMNGLFDATRRNKKAWDEAGISLFEADGSMRSMADIIQDLEGYLGNMTVKQREAALAQLGFNLRTKDSILTLMGSSEKIRKWTEDLKNMGGKTKEVSEKQLEAFNNQLKLLKNTVTNAAISIGESLAPMIKDLIVKIKDVSKSVSDWIKEHPKLTAIIAKATLGIGALLIVLGPLTMMLPGIITALPAIGAGIHALLGPIGLVTAAAVVAYNVINDLIKAKEDMIDADYRAFEAEHKYGQKLREAADMAGLTRKEYIKLERAYNGNVAALGMAIIKGKEGKELQEALIKVGKKHKEVINEQKKSLITLKDIGIKPVIQSLEQIKTVITNTAIPAGEKFLGFTYNLQSELKSGFFKTWDEIEVDGKDTEKAIEKSWDELHPYLSNLCNNLGDSFGNFAYGIMDKGSTLGENLKGLWTDIGNSFKSMVADYIADEAKKLFLGIASDTVGMAANVTSGLSAIGPAITGIASGIAGLITTLAAAIATAATTLAAAAPSLMVVLGIALATYAGFKLISSLFKKKGAGDLSYTNKLLEDINWIQLNAVNLKLDVVNSNLAGTLPVMVNELFGIWDTTEGILNALTAKGTVYVDVFRSAVMDRIGQKTDMLGNKFESGLGGLGNKFSIGLKDGLKQVGNKIGGIKFDTKGIIKAIKGREYPSAQTGAVLTAPGLVETHGTPAEPEFIIPSRGIEKFVPSGNTSATKIIEVKMDLQQTFAFNNQVDPNFTRKYVLNEIIPIMYQGIETGARKTKLKEILGVS